MVHDRYQQMRRDAQHLLPVSESAVAVFDHSFPKILTLVNEKFFLEAQFQDKEITPDQECILKDSHKRFGEFLLAVYAFHLYDHLVDELSRYMCVLSSRGFERDYFDAIIKTWDIAIHSVVNPPESHELARPLEWLHHNLSLIYDRCSVVSVQKSEELDEFLGFLFSKKRRGAADYMLSLLQQGHSIETLYSDLITAALRETGGRWQKNEMSVVDVHVVTDICRYVIMRLVDSVVAEKELPYRALVACVPGEEHEMGAEIVENYLEMKGWRVDTMGHIAPEADIVHAITTNTPDVVFLSITLVSNLIAARALAERIRALAPRLKIVMGGYAAVLARDTLSNFADAIVDGIEDTHRRSLELVTPHA